MYVEISLLWFAFIFASQGQVPYVFANHWDAPLDWGAVSKPLQINVAALHGKNHRHL